MALTVQDAAMATKTGVSLHSDFSVYAGRTQDYWSFRGRAAREGAHIFFQYPAMMVPQMQAELLRLAKNQDQSIRHVYDPFAGSGTVLTESMMQGLDFTGQDINPLAVLLCHAKSIPHRCDSLERKVQAALDTARRDASRRISACFPGRRKWFREDVSVGLSRIRRAIRREPAQWARRFLWVALAETVRQTSNSRTSTFKLHMRPDQEIDNRSIRPIDVFESVVARNLDHLRRQEHTLRNRGLLHRGVYQGTIDIHLADCLDEWPDSKSVRFDLLLTSPPYGDNASTVPYGQHSYLPLRWIDLHDIDPAATDNFLRTTHEIDSRSLGGSRRVALVTRDLLFTISPTFRQTIHRLRNTPPDRAKRVAAFCIDLSRAVGRIVSRLRPGAIMIWIIGNRRVGQQEVPMDQILSEILIARGARDLKVTHRAIPTKRSAARNSISRTIRREAIIVARHAH